jgi:hypothetical protein
VNGCPHQRLLGLLVLLPLLVASCDAADPPPEASTAFDAGAFDPTTAATIRGQVEWSGDLPNAPPMRARIQFFNGTGGKELVRDNPNAPAIDPKGRGIGGAVVYLRGVDPKRARPWDHAPVHVEQRSYRLYVHQGGAKAGVGFVRRGDAVEMVSTQAVLHTLRARGAAFFTLAFPEPNQPLARRLEKKGVVELSSGAGYYWMRAHLLVDDHPYYTRTDAEGRFTLAQVPPGRYDVVCWMPNWNKERHERNPDTGFIARWFFRPPAEIVQSVTLEPSESCEVKLSVAAEAFEGERGR